MGFTQLVRHRDDVLESRIRQVGRENGLHNLFNPSVLVHRGVTYVAIRANEVPLYRPFRSYLITFAPDSEPRLTDLTEAGAAVRVAPVADPKLLVLDDHVYATFNTGHRAEGTNDIYLINVDAGSLGPFQRVQFDGRRRIEKNWAFYRNGAGELTVLYNLAPPQTLQHTGGRLGTDDTLIFESKHEIEHAEYMQPMHIGTQITSTGETSALLIANQRFTAARRAIYYGRLVELELSTATLTRIGRKRLINSWRTFRRPSPLHNPSLLTATYFSGVFFDGNQLTVSFGINDVDFGIAHCQAEDLW